MLTLLAAFAEFERSLLRERQAEGIAIAKAKGVYKGRKKALAADEAQELVKLARSGMPGRTGAGLWDQPGDRLPVPANRRGSSDAWSDRLEFNVPPGPNETTPDLRIARRLRNAIYEIEIDYASRHSLRGNTWNLFLRGIGLFGTSSMPEVGHVAEARNLLKRPCGSIPTSSPRWSGMRSAWKANLCGSSMAAMP